MNILFLSLLDFDTIEEHNIYADLLRKFYQEGHGVYVVSPIERKKHEPSKCLNINERLCIIKPKIGNIQKTNIIEKGVSTITLEHQFISVIKKYCTEIKFDLVLYTTPPITLQKTVNYVKKRDHAVTYLMLKDIFPQNAVDMGMLSIHGVKGVLYRYLRNKEKKLYRDSDYIGCMSEANVTYVKKHNPQVEANRVEICPNCMEPIGRTVTEEEKKNIREKLGIPQDKLLFVYGGNLGKPQGIPFLIECLQKMKQNRDIYFWIVGNGTEYSKLEAFVKSEKPQNVRLMQALPKEEYENAVLAADVGMIFLDYRFTIPNFPSRLLSYMDAGIPVLSVTDDSTDMGDIVEKGKFGWKCLSRDAEDVIRKIEEIAKIEDLTVYGENGRRFLNEHYDVKNAYGAIIKHMNIKQ